MRCKLLTILVLSVGLFWSPTPLSADLGRYETGIIRAAFMNGCVRALAWDLETIRSLQRDPEALRRRVQAEVERYVTEVHRMNREPYVMEPIPGGPGESKERGWLW